MKVKTAHEMEEERLRTLYIRLPHTIKNIDEIRDLIFGDVNIKLPRQSGRHCHVIFPTVEEKLKNMKSLKKKLIDNKHIFVSNSRVKSPDVERAKKVKTRKPSPKEITKPEQKENISKICFIHKIPKSASVKDLKLLFPGAKNVAILYKQRLQDDGKGRSGIVKFKDVKTAAAYLKKEIPWPMCKGVQLEMNSDKRKQKNRDKKKKKGTASLKIYDGDEVKSETDEAEVKDEDEAKSEAEAHDDEDDDDDKDEDKEESAEENNDNKETSDEEE